MRGDLCLDFDRVLCFVREHMRMPVSEGMRAIGLERDGALVAGVLFEGFNGQNIWMHVAAEPGGRWMSRRFLGACFRYPFVGLGARRASIHVAEGNAASHRLGLHLGFTEEARLKGAAHDGGDLLLMVMWRDQCRFLGERYGQGIQRASA